jgi:eukaryotic-like serine/threonine-protein kinase
VGSIIGTIQYMSPEQIEGKEADARSDIFAFGAVLYEMSAGKRPFSGKSQISVASSILESDPEPISALKPQIPAAFEHVVKTCLQKNPEERYLAAHDIRLELQWIAAERPAAAPAAAAQATSLRQKVWWIAALLVAIALGVAAGFFFERSAQSAQAIRTVIDPPAKTTVNLIGDAAGPPVLSPDGASIAFAATGADGKSAIWVRPMNLLEARLLPGTENAIFPFWSPDGRSIGFFADNKLKTIDLNGGSAQVVADAPFGRGGAWGPGVILFSPSTQSALMRVSASGGTPVPITKLDVAHHTSHRWPFFLPDGKHFLYLAINHDPARAANNALYYASLDGRENREVMHVQSNAVYSNGYLLFAHGDQLTAQPFDPATGKLGEEAQNVAKGVADDLSTWHMDASASEGLLVFASGGTGDWQLLWMDRSGKQLGIVADKLTNLQSARISPQGDRIAIQIDTGLNDIWVLDVARGIRTRLTFGPVSNTFPVWSPDGKWIAYTSDRNGRSNLLRKPSDGSGAEELLFSDEQVDVASDWSRDGKYLIYSRGLSVGDAGIWALPLEGEHKPSKILPRGIDPRLSPDGRWLAYTSDESGAPEVYVVPFRGGQGKWQVSANGGQEPEWSKDGKDLYYFDSSYNLFAVPVKDTGGTLQFGVGQTLVATWTAPNIFYDVAPDGKKILLDRVSQQVSQSVTVVTNFTAGLRK